MSVSVTRILSPEEWKKRQIGNLKAVGETNYKVGIAHPRKDPIEAGIKAEDKYQNAMKKVLEERRRAKGLERTNMQEWFKFASDLGSARLVEGVVKREEKVDRFVRSWQPLLSDHVSKIDSMPDATDKDREERMLANLRGLKALKGKW